MQTPQIPDSTVINVSISLQRLNGNQALLKSLAEFFLEDAPGLFEQLLQGMHTKNDAQVVRCAHSLRGLASTFEATSVVRLAEQIENSGRNAEWSQVVTKANEFRDELIRLTAALKAIASQE